MEQKIKALALVAHDNMKRDLAEWVDWNCAKLSPHHLICTGTTGKMVEKTLRDHRREHDKADGPHPDLRITLLKSGPLGGDQQLGSLIADGRINALIFFWDPMVGPAARCRCQGAAAPGDALQRSHGHQPLFGRLPDLLAAVRG